MIQYIKYTIKVFRTRWLFKEPLFARRNHYINIDNGLLTLAEYNQIQSIEHSLKKVN